MIPFNFIYSLFDQKQYELFVNSVIGLLYDRQFYDEDKIICWLTKFPPNDHIYVYIPFGESTEKYFKEIPECQRLIRETILKKLKSDGSDARNIVKEIIIKDNKLADQTIKQAISELEDFIFKFKATTWLNDKVFILEELQSIKQIILDLIKGTRTKINNNGSKLIWQAGSMSLGKLFYDLKTLKSDNKEHFIKEDLKEIAHFIVANFLDIGGENFEFDKMYEAVKKHKAKLTGFSAEESLSEYLDNSDK